MKISSDGFSQSGHQLEKMAARQLEGLSQYHAHGGDLFDKKKEVLELHTCVIRFPINVEAVVMINTDLSGENSQCTILKNTYDNAWVNQ